MKKNNLVPKYKINDVVIAMDVDSEDNKKYVQGVVVGAEYRRTEWDYCVKSFDSIRDVYRYDWYVESSVLNLV